MLKKTFYMTITCCIICIVLLNVLPTDQTSQSIHAQDLAYSAENNIELFKDISLIGNVSGVRNGLIVNEQFLYTLGHNELSIFDISDIETQNLLGTPLFLPYL